MVGACRRRPLAGHWQARPSRGCYCEHLGPRDRIMQTAAVRPWDSRTRSCLARARARACVCDSIGLLYRDVESDKAIFQIILQIGQALNGPFVMHVFEPGRQAAAEMSCAELSWSRSVCTVLCSDTAAALPRRVRGGGRRSSLALRLARQTARRLGAWALGLEARRWPRRRPSEGIVSTMEGAVCAC